MPKGNRLISKHNMEISSMNNGFQLVEILIVLTLASILVTFSIPIYSELLCREHKTEAEFALAKLAIAMEHYHLEHDSYQGASISTLGVDSDVAHQYRLEITAADGSHFLLTAIPVSSKLSKLTINELGVKG